MYVKRLNKEEELLLLQRRNKIKDYQEKGICFSCQNFITGYVFPDDGFVGNSGNLMKI